MVYGLFGGLFVANIAMLLIGMVILTPAIWLVNRPKPYLLAVIYALIFSGIYSIDHSLFDLGIVLAAGVIAREARQQAKKLDHHLSHMAVHGMLHLMGYDHEDDADAEIMEALEIEALAGMGIANPYETRP